MALIDIIKYDGPQNVLVWKWHSKSSSSREEEIRWGSQLVVNQSQEACFIKGGQLLDVLGPGTHTLSTKNLPLISAIIGLPFGGDSPFKAEVYFVNKSVSMDVKFGLVPFNMVEPNFKAPIPITSRGSFALTIINSTNFLNKVVGAVSSFDTQALSQYFRGSLTECVKNSITKIAHEQEISPFELESIAYEVSIAAKPIISEVISEFGLAIKLFNIEGISIVYDDPRVKKLLEDYQKMMSEDAEERLRLKRRKENLEIYKIERSFDTSEKIAENLGGNGAGAGNIVGTMIGMSMVPPIATAMNNILANTVQPVSSNLNNQPTELSTPGNYSNNSFDHIFEAIKKLGELKESGFVTEDEFNSKKKELLSKIK